MATLAAVLALVAAGGAGAAEYGAGVVRVEVRVLQNVEDGREIHISARPATGSWQALGRIPLALDDGFSPRGRYRYGDISVDVRLPNRSTPVTVEVWVWQDVRDDQNIYISARGSLGEWDTLGTIPLPLDDGLTPDRTLRFGDIRLEVPLLPEQVSTLAGWPGLWGYRDGQGDEARFGRAFDDVALGLAVARDGSVIVADRWNHAIRRIAPDGTVTTVAGIRGAGLQDGPAENARFHWPTDVAVDTDGAIYVADSGNHRIRKITPDGMVTTVAGSDRSGAGLFEIRNGPALQALFNRPVGLALDLYGDLYVIELYAVRRLSPSGWVSTVAGDNRSGSRDGPGKQAQFDDLTDIATDDAGNVYVIDSHRMGIGYIARGATIRKIDTAGVVTTLYRDDHLPALGGTLASPSGLAVTGDGALYIANTGRNQIVRLTSEGNLQAVAGTGEAGNLDGPLQAATFKLPRRIALAPGGVLVVADHMDSVVRKIVPGEGGLGGEAIPLADFEPLPRVAGVRITVFAGSGDQGLVDGPAHQAELLFPRGLALDHSGNVVFADSGNNAIRVSAPDGTVTTLAGGNGHGVRDGPCEEAQFARPEGVAVHVDGSIYVADSIGNRIRRISTECSVTTVAGDAPGFQDGPAAEARFNYPGLLAFDHEGNLFIAETGGSLIRRLSPDGQVSTVAGSFGRTGSRDGHADEALLISPRGIAVDEEGNIFFTENSNAIRKIDGNGFVSTVFKTPDFLEGGALSPFTRGIAVGSQGELYVADKGYGRVLRLTSDGVLSIVIDGEHAIDWRGLGPSGILVMPDGNLLVSDSVMSVIWKISFEDEAEE